MELWIRSQDEEVLGKAKEIMIYEKEKRCEIIINNYTYGTYATKERALEVLDEIQRLITPTIEYNPVIKKEESWEEEYQRTVLKGYDVKVEQAITYVYNMPKE